MKKISTTRLASKLGMDRNDLFKKLAEEKLIFLKEKKYHLTKKGYECGAKMILTSDQKEFIGWPESFNPYKIEKSSTIDVLNATKIGEKFGISNRRVNNILSEVGWIEKSIQGWQLTLSGSRHGGIQKEHQSGGTYVLWPTSILSNSIFIRSINPETSSTTNDIVDDKKDENIIESDKYPSKLLKSKDGHLVRSRGELIIDNMLYDYGISHAYERELPIADLVKCDFYIPSRNNGKAVYIEFWGINDNESYLHRKKIKQEIYIREGYNLIEIEEEHLDNLDGYLPKELLKFNIKVE